MSNFFPLYHYSFKFFFPPSIVCSFLPSLFPLYCYFLPSTKPFSIVLLLFPHLPLFYPLYHCSSFLSPWLSPIYHHALLSVITFSPLLSLPPFELFFSLMPSLSPFCHYTLSFCHCSFSFHCSFPFAIAHSHLPSLFPFCHQSLPFTIAHSLPFAIATCN